MRLEEQAGVEQRLAQQPLGHQLQHDQQAADAAIAIEERVDGFKLDMCKGGFYEQRRFGRSIVYEFF